MIRTVLPAAEGAGHVAFFGLSDADIDHLRHGGPILVNLAHHGLPEQKILLAWAPTDEATLVALRSIMPDTEFFDGKRLSN